MERRRGLNPPVWSADGLPLPDATAAEFIIDAGGDGHGFYRLVHWAGAEDTAHPEWCVLKARREWNRRKRR